MTGRDLKPGERAIITSGRAAVYDVGILADVFGVSVVDVLNMLDLARVTSKGVSLTALAEARDAELARKGA